MSNSVMAPEVRGYAYSGMIYGKQVYDAYESGRAEVINYAQKRLSPLHAELVSRITSCVSEIFVDLCALTGVFVVPAAILWGVKRLIPMYGIAAEYLRKGATADSKHEKWVEVKEDYKRSFRDVMGPALLVAFSVDAAFCLALGVFTLNGALLLRASALAIPASIFIYKNIVSHPQEGQASEFGAENDPLVSMPGTTNIQSD